MLLITNSRRMWLIGMAVSVRIFLLVYFTVLRPSTDTANQAVKTGLQQTQQVLGQAQKQLSGVATQPGGSSEAQQQLGNAAKLTSCVAAAGTDVAQIQSCRTKYGN